MVTGRYGPAYWYAGSADRPAVFVGDFGLDCYEINISDDLEKESRSSEGRNCVRTDTSCLRRLRLATNITVIA